MFKTSLLGVLGTIDVVAAAAADEEGINDDGFDVGAAAADEEGINDDGFDVGAAAAADDDDDDDDATGVDAILALVVDED